MGAPRTVRRTSAPLATLAAAALLAACSSAADPAAPATPATPAGTAGTSVAAAPATTPAPSPATTTPDATTTTPAAPDDAFTIVAGGDVLLHEPTWEQADADLGTTGDGALDFRPQLAAIRPLVAGADLAICHMETPIAPAAGPYSGYPSFNVPPQIAPALAATGFDACSVASNHTYDRGLDGLQRTVTALRDAGITPYGGKTGGAPGNPTGVSVPTSLGRVQLALISYTYGFNGALPPDAGNRVERIDIADIAHDAAAARAAGASIVVASLHWGTEYDHDPNAMQRELMPQLAALADVDVIISHHAHVVEPIAQVDGKWVTYGLGNMIAAQATDDPDNRVGILAKFTLRPAAEPSRWTVESVAYQVIYVDRGPPLRIVELPQAIATAPDEQTRARYQAALDSTRAAVTLLGAAPAEIDSE